MSKYLIFFATHMQDPGQYSINTEANDKFAVPNIDERLVCKSYTESDIVKIEEKTENAFDL